jgi:K+-sensing histidine kinase KdpD
MWVISVRDNGIGFEQGYAEQIFGLFNRLNRRGSEGTGLDLAICKRIIEANGGRIWAQSEIGVGSTFFSVFRFINRRPPEIRRESKRCRARITDALLRLRLFCFLLFLFQTLVKLGFEQ